MSREYWAQRRRAKSGPHESREAALQAFREANPFKGPPYMAKARENRILTGYGNGGAYFDIKFHDATGESSK